MARAAGRGDAARCSVAAAARSAALAGGGRLQPLSCKTQWTNENNGCHLWQAETYTMYALFTVSVSLQHCWSPRLEHSSAAATPFGRQTGIFLMLGRSSSRARSSCTRTGSTCTPSSAPPMSRSSSATTPSLGTTRARLRQLPLPLLLLLPRWRERPGSIDWSRGLHYLSFRPQFVTSKLQRVLSVGGPLSRVFALTLKRH